jgi:hypothetical protein
MHRAAPRYLHEPFTLGFIKISGQIDLAIDLIKHAGVFLTILAIPGINTIVTKLHLNTFQRKFLSFRIHAERDGYSRTQNCE